MPFATGGTVAGCFRAGFFTFSLVNVHLYYGSEKPADIARRCLKTSRWRRGQALYRGIHRCGTALVYTLMFLALLAISAQVGTSRYSVDAILERHVPWWSRIAEVTPKRASISTNNA
jgi:hypothetical protein